MIMEKENIIIICGFEEQGEKLGDFIEGQTITNSNVMQIKSPHMPFM